MILITKSQKEVPLALPRLFSFRTRSPDRDQQTDATRLAVVASAVEGQLIETEREMRGLKARVDHAYLGATSLLEASSGYSNRSAEEEAEIRAFESSADAARQRLARLEQQKALLERIRAMLQHESNNSGPDLG